VPSLLLLEAIAEHHSDPQVREAAAQAIEIVKAEVADREGKIDPADLKIASQLERLSREVIPDSIFTTFEPDLVRPKGIGFAPPDPEIPPIFAMTMQERHDDGTEPGHGKGRGPISILERKFRKDFEEYISTFHETNEGGPVEPTLHKLTA